MRSKAFLYVKAEVHNITILHDVVFALKSHLASLFSSIFAAMCDVVLVAYHFSSDKAPLKVVVDDACCFWRFPAICDRPSPYFYDASCEIAYQI